MKGNEVVATTDPRGVWLEGIISGTPKPGVMMELVASTEPVSGKFTYRAYQPGTGDGTPAPVIILREDHLQGKGIDDAYVDGTRCFMYMPIAGEMMNVRKPDISGTGSPTEDLNIGELLMPLDGTGKFAPAAVGLTYAGAAGVFYPFTCYETLSDQPAEMLVYSMYNGNMNK